MGGQYESTVSAGKDLRGAVDGELVPYTPVRTASPDDAFSKDTKDGLGGPDSCVEEGDLVPNGRGDGCEPVDQSSASKRFPR